MNVMNMRSSINLMKNTYWWFILFTGFLFISSGCTLIDENFSRPLAPAQADHVPVDEQPHYREVMENLGAPLLVSADDDNLFFLYEYALTKERQLGISVDIEAVPWLKWIKLSFARAKADHQALVMIFDKGGYLMTSQYGEWERDLGDGSSIELFLSTHRLVDTTSYTDKLGPNEWGATLLRPLPEVLNRASSLDTGENGLELVSTPVKAGQHTLELRR